MRFKICPLFVILRQFGRNNQFLELYLKLEKSFMKSNTRINKFLKSVKYIYIRNAGLYRSYI